MSAGFQWRYYDGDDSDISPLVNVMTKNLVYPIRMISKNGTVIEYENVTECVKANPQLKAPEVNKVLRGVNKTHHGYKFEYVNDSQDKDIV